MHRKVGPKTSSAVLSSPDKRRELRLPASGQVRIFVDEGIETEIDAILVDVSASGFRASHLHAALSKGQTVQFEHPGAKGLARVIWNRITPGAIETGFLIV